MIIDSRIKEIDWLTDEDLDKPFFKNAVNVFGLHDIEAVKAAAE